MISADGVVVDIGCADDADLSKYFLNKTKMTVFGVDPTKAHSRALEGLDSLFDNFTYVPLAISANDGHLTFYHNEKHRSGSLLAQHVNVSETTQSYEVECTTLGGLFKRIQQSRVSYVKMDIEGAELRVLENASDQEILLAEQYFIEFHPHAFADYNEKTVKDICARFESLGYRVATCDNINILFYRP
jgi:FkbM family methyltransferase